MGFIVAKDALGEIISANPVYPTVRWLEAQGVRPYIALTTIAQALDAIHRDPDLGIADRQNLERGVGEIIAQLRSGAAAAGVLPAILDHETARILAELIDILRRGPENGLGDLDLPPAAIAMQHGYRLVATDDAPAWRDIAARIPRRLGALMIFDPADEVDRIGAGPA